MVAAGRCCWDPRHCPHPRGYSRHVLPGPLALPISLGSQPVRAARTLGTAHIPGVTAGMCCQDPRHCPHPQGHSQCVLPGPSALPTSPGSQPVCAARTSFRRRGGWMPPSWCTTGKEPVGSAPPLLLALKWALLPFWTHCADHKPPPSCGRGGSCLSEQGGAGKGRSVTGVRDVAVAGGVS